LTDISVVPDDSKDKEQQSEPLPHDLLNDLKTLQLYYPGYQRDFKAAQQAFEDRSLEKFQKMMHKLKEKQRVYDQYRSFTRLNELAGLELAYPGYDEDVQDLEKWHLAHPPSDENDALFRDKIEGLRNKDALFFGDRSHPNIVALDGLTLTYPNWEVDLTEATKVHCDQPAHYFPDKLHMLREKQRIHDGDRSHWRLKHLDALHLTYPGWENDLAQVENWHLNHADTPQNTTLFAEVIEGMRDQQIIYLGWDREGDDDDDEHEDQKDLENANSYCNNSDDQGCVAQLIESMESRRKNAAKAAVASSCDFKKMPRSSSPSSTSSTASSSDPFKNDQSIGSSSTVERRTGPPSSSSPPLRAEQDMAPPGFSTGSTNPTSWLLSSPSSEGIATSNNESVNKNNSKKTASLGKCIVCLSRSKTHVFVPCGHLCCCAACGTHAMETGALCPICRTDADNVYRVFY
jgi:hypothetical protein